MTLVGSGTNATSDVIWTVWNDSVVTTTGCATNTATITSTTGSIWPAWNQQFVQTVGTSSIITNTQVWAAWNAILVNTRGIERLAVPAVPAATPEQVAAAQRREQEYRANQEIIRVERSLAEKRAEKLLHESLDPKQREELAAKGFFTLETLRPTGERRIYRIRRGRSRNVEQIDANGKRLKTLCAHPIANVPADWGTHYSVWRRVAVKVPERVRVQQV